MRSRSRQTPGSPHDRRAPDHLSEEALRHTSSPGSRSSRSPSAPDVASLGDPLLLRAHAAAPVAGLRAHPPPAPPKTARRAESAGRSATCWPWSHAREPACVCRCSRRVGCADGQGRRCRARTSTPSACWSGSDRATGVKTVWYPWPNGPWSWCGSYWPRAPPALVVHRSRPADGSPGDHPPEDLSARGTPEWPRQRRLASPTPARLCHSLWRGGVVARHPRPPWPQASAYHRARHAADAHNLRRRARHHPRPQGRPLTALGHGPALAKLFRGLCLDLVRRERPDLTLPEVGWTKGGGVYGQPTTQVREPGLTSLGHDVHRMALTNHHLRSIAEGQVGFRDQDSEDPRWQTMPLPAPECIRRFWPHVLPPGCHNVRDDGLWSPVQRPLLHPLQLGLAGSAADPSPPSPTPPPQATNAWSPPAARVTGVHPAVRASAS